MVGVVDQLLTVGQVHQLQPRRDDAAGPQDREGVELHLEQGLGLVGLAGGTAGLVVDDPDLAGRRDVDAVDEPRISMSSASISTCSSTASASKAVGGFSIV